MTITTRVAMRSGSGTGTTGLNWLLSDHLGSTGSTPTTAVVGRATFKLGSAVRWDGRGRPVVTYNLACDAENCWEPGRSRGAGQPGRAPGKVAVQPR